MKEEMIDKEVEEGVRALFGNVSKESEGERKEDERGRESVSETIEDIDEDVEIAHIKKVEAALFIAGRFLSLQELVALTDVNPILLRKILTDLEGKYRESGIDVTEERGKW